MTHKKSALKLSISSLALATALGSFGTAQAIEYQADGADIRIDTTLSYGALFRITERDPDLIAIGNGGNSHNINADDGNLNYDEGAVSSVFRATHDIDIRSDFADAFVRFTYFYDTINANAESTEFSDLSDRTVRQIGRDIRLLDAYVSKDFEVAGLPVNFRLGNQVLNWGESALIPNGVSVINPVDVSALRSPGAEIKNALLPVQMASFNAALTRNLSFEAFYQFDWEGIETDPAGSFFGSDVGIGGDVLYTTPGSRPEDDEFYFAETALAAFGGGTNVLGYAVPRGTDDLGNAGDFGFAFRYFAENLNNTEFGFYYINYDSRRPILSFRNPTSQDYSVPSVFTADNAASTTEYFFEYPDNIELFGLSFNTGGPFGATLNGDFTLRKDQPLQLDGSDLLQAAQNVAVSELNAALLGYSGADQATLDAVAGAGTYATLVGQTTGLGSLIAANNPVAAANGYSVANGLNFTGDDTTGFERFDVLTAQISAIKTFAPIPALNVDQWVGLVEFGVNHVIDFNDSDFVFEGPNTDQYASFDSTLGVVGVEDATGQPDETSMGYRVRLRFDMLNAVGPWSLFPQVSWAHDISGTTPLPLSTFVENRATLNLGLTARYLETVELGIAYQEFFAIGDDEYISLRDRDFVNFTTKIRF